MRPKTFLTAAVALAIGAFAFKPIAASAEIQYPWCQRNANGDGGDSCAFESLEQCRQSLSSGAQCVQNIWYKEQSVQPPVQPPPAPVSTPPPPAQRPRR
jgi:hypothetical protein